METNEVLRTALASLTHVGLMVVGAIVLLIIGRWLIAFAVGMVTRSLEKQRVDPTLLRYLGNILSVILNVALIVAILGYFGVETTTFAALLAAAGVAIGMAWSGLLANFAAGAFIIVLRPFKAGDFITAGGVTGTVKEIGLFVTTINTLDNVLTILGNNKIFSDNIQNFSVNAYRRVDLAAQLNHAVDHNAAIRVLKERLMKIPNVMADPAPDVEILTFNLAGPVAGGAPVLPHRSLLAGVFRHQPGDSRVLWRRALPGSGAALRRAQCRSRRQQPGRGGGATARGDTCRVSRERSKRSRAYTHAAGAIAALPPAKGKCDGITNSGLS